MLKKAPGRYGRLKMEKTREIQVQGKQNEGSGVPWGGGQVGLVNGDQGVKV